jgi:CHAT domain-containing protein
LEGSGWIIHVSCHGATAADFAVAGLLLADSHGLDYWVSSAEILQRGTFAGTRLVVLSACSTGGLIDHRTSIQSFGGVDMAFIGSGASTVASTLWNVYDVVTAIFSLALHLRLESGDPIVQAHTAAIGVLQQPVDDWPGWLVSATSESLAGSLDSIRQLPEWPHPLYWASFRILLGSARDAS